MSIGRHHLNAMLMKLGLTRAQAAQVITEIMGMMHERLSERDHVAIQGFGSFRFHQNRRTVMWDPRIKRSRTIRGKLLLRFKPSQQFLDMLNKRPR